MKQIKSIYDLKAAIKEALNGFNHDNFFLQYQFWSEHEAPSYYLCVYSWKGTRENRVFESPSYTELLGRLSVSIQASFIKETELTITETSHD